MKEKKRFTAGMMVVRKFSPEVIKYHEFNPGASGAIDFQSNPVRTRGFVLDKEAAINTADLLVNASKAGKLVFWTGHYANNNEDGFHTTVVIPKSYLHDPEQVGDKQMACFGCQRAFKLVPRVGKQFAKTYGNLGQSAINIIKYCIIS